MKIVDHFAATLATWFGAGATQLATVFPKLSSLGQARLDSSNQVFADLRDLWWVVR